MHRASKAQNAIYSGSEVVAVRFGERMFDGVVETETYITELVKEPVSKTAVSNEKVYGYHTHNLT